MYVVVGLCGRTEYFFFDFIITIIWTFGSVVISDKQDDPFFDLDLDNCILVLEKKKKKKKKFVYNAYLIT